VEREHFKNTIIGRSGLWINGSSESELIRYIPNQVLKRCSNLLACLRRQVWRKVLDQPIQGLIRAAEKYLQVTVNALIEARRSKYGASLRTCPTRPVVQIDGVSAAPQPFAYRWTNSTLTHHHQVGCAPQQGGDQQLKWRWERASLSSSSVEHEYSGKCGQLRIAQTGRDDI
jgi:hypothetical protein